MAGPDFKRIRETVPIVDVLDYLGIDYKWARKQVRAKCPLCRSKTPRVFAATPGINLFRCFKCHEKGDAIELVSQVLKISKYEAAKELQKQFNSS